MDRNNIEMNKTNGSTKYYTGKRIKTSYGWLTILGQLPAEEINGRKYTYYRVQFDTGYVTHSLSSSLNRKQIRDPYYPSVYATGFMGVGIWAASIQGKQTQEYTCWKSMLARCYSEAKQKDCPTYKGCTVDPRWHNFQNFCEDIQELEGYAEWKANYLKHRWNLDKDMKGHNTKIYSKDNCIFVAQEDNSKEMWKRKGPNHMTRNTYEGTRLSDGYTEVFRNVTAFKHKYNITGSPYAVAMRESNRTQTCGWDFKIISE